MIKSRILECLTWGIFGISFFSNNLEFCIRITFMLERVIAIPISLGKRNTSIILTQIIYSCILNRLSIILNDSWWSYCISNSLIDIIPTPNIRYRGPICSFTYIFRWYLLLLFPSGIFIFPEIHLIILVTVRSHRHRNIDLRVLSKAQGLSIWLSQINIESIERLQKVRDVIFYTE